jgi:membrane protein YqaA with SNARE-associated domain
MCLAISYCNSIVLSSSASTFGWWMGYLLKNEDAKVFYNNKISKKNDHTKDKFTQDIFLEDWISIEVENGKGYRKISPWMTNSSEFVL